MHSIEIASYLASAAAFLAFTALLAVNWHGRRTGALLILAAMASVLWGGFLAFAGWQETLPISWVFFAEILRYAAWLAFLSALLGSLRAQSLLKGLRFGIHALWGVLALYCLLAATGLTHILPVRFLLGVPITGILILALAGLVFLEQLYRNVQPEQRWALKFLVIALGIMFAYDFFLYSYAALYGRVNQGVWSARGFINALVVPLLAVAAARNPDWSLKVAVSRRVVFYSSSLLAASIYIAATVVAGYYVRFYGGNWGKVAEITLICLAIMVLLLVAFSGQARSRLRMFLHKNFFNYRHDYREEWLKLTATLSSGKADLPVQAIQAMAQIMDSPAGVLLTRNEAGEFVLAASWNMPVPADVKIRCALPVFEFMRARQWIYDVSAPPPLGDDANLTVPHEISGLRHAWLLVPLILETRLTGLVVLAQARARRKLDWEDIDLLRAAGSQVASTLAQADSARRLAKTRQFEGFNRLTAFVMHDIKNLVAQQSLLIKNAERHKHNQSFVEDMLATVANSVRRMTRLLEQLRADIPSGARSRVRLNVLIERVIAECGLQSPKPEYAPAAEEACVQAEPEQLAAILGHIIRNAQDAVRGQGHVIVRLRTERDQAVIEVEDDGEGMDEEFIRTQLFEPFFTTKASKGMGIGAYQAREYVQSLGGSVLVKSVAGHGTIFSMFLPLDARSHEIAESDSMRAPS